MDEQGTNQMSDTKKAISELFESRAKILDSICDFLSDNPKSKIQNLKWEVGGDIAHRSRHRRHVYGRGGIRRSKGLGGTGEGALDPGGIGQGGPGSAHQGGDSAQYGFFVDTRYDRCRECDRRTPGRQDRARYNAGFS